MPLRLVSPLLAALILVDPPPPPEPPADLRVTAVTSTSITLAWTASPSPVAGYDVTYTQAFDDIVRQQQLGPVTTVTVTSGVRPTGQYSLRVAARDADGRRSAGSNTVSVVTPASDTAADRTPPSAPAGLTATGAGLTWSPSTDDTGVTGYDVYQFDGLYLSRLLGTVTGTSFTSTVRGTHYVRARDAAGNLSAVSNMATVTIPTTGPTTPPAPACRVAFRTTAQWAGGFVTEVTVASTPAVTGWALAFRFGGDQRITSAWNATAAQTGADVTLTAANWNRMIAAGGSATAGLLGAWSASAAPPTAATLNGAPCAVL
ncbi:MAG: cellulose binding domain-containing protein [Actinoplanes sp.]